VPHVGLLCESKAQLEGHSVEHITSDLDLWPWASTTYSALPCCRCHLCTKFRQNPL